MTTIHAAHIRSNRSHNDCDECRADNQRTFVNLARWQYSHVHDYLGYIKPRLEAIHAGEDSVNACIWLRDFRKALHSKDIAQGSRCDGLPQVLRWIPRALPRHQPRKGCKLSSLVRRAQGQHVKLGDKDMTIYRALEKKLGRPPTDEELKADVKRILQEAMQDMAGKGKLSFQKRKH